MLVLLSEIRVKEGRRKVDADYAQELADSIRELGLLSPITVDHGNVLIAGLHRLEAVRRLGWEKVECTVCSLEGLKAEMAEIDENLIRKDLSAVEHGEILLRRKEIYEMLHPETKAGLAQAAAMNRVLGNNVADKMSATSKSFVDETAKKLGVTPRTVRRELQTARDLSPAAKEIIKNADARITKKDALKLSRLEPEKQEEVAALLADNEIKSMDEYQPAAASLKEVVAELKDSDKDCSGTPESFLEEYAAFTAKFQREIAWYDNPYYDGVYLSMSEGQLERLRRMTDTLCSFAERLFHKVEKQVRGGRGHE